MKNSIADISERKAAIVAGLGILILVITGAYVFFALNTGLDVPGDAAIKAANDIKTNQWLLCIFILSLLIMITCNVILALTLYVLVKSVNYDHALLAAVIRLIYAIMFTISMVFLFFVPLSFSTVFIIGQIIYALHILILGYLIFKSGYIPRILGVLLIIGGSLGYLIESFTFFFFPNYVWIAAPGIVVATIADILLGIWLLLKNGKIPDMIEEISEE